MQNFFFGLEYSSCVTTKFNDAPTVNTSNKFIFFNFEQTQTYMRWTQEELNDYVMRLKSDAKIVVAAQKLLPKKRKNKYQAIATVVDSITFASKLESNYYRVLKEAVKKGDILFFVRQVPFYLKGAKLVVDFMVVRKDGVSFEDTKGGRPTEAWAAKRRMVEARYPIKIILRGKDFVTAMMREYGLK